MQRDDADRSRRCREVTKKFQANKMFNSHSSNPIIIIIITQLSGTHGVRETAVINYPEDGANNNRILLVSLCPLHWVREEALRILCSIKFCITYQTG